MILYLRAEREAEWSLHLWAVERIIPYFFAAGHVNYARYGVLPDDVLEKFLKGEHVMRHNTGLWNGLWSDTFIETTFMHYGKGPGGIVVGVAGGIVAGGIVGVTLKPSTVKRVFTLPAG